MALEAELVIEAGRVRVLLAWSGKDSPGQRSHLLQRLRIILQGAGHRCRDHSGVLVVEARETDIVAERIALWFSHHGVPATVDMDERSTV